MCIRDRHQCCRRIALRKLHARLADGQRVRPRHLGGGDAVALMQQRQHLHFRHLRAAQHEVVLVHGLFGLRQQRNRPRGVTLHQLQARQKNLAGDKTVGLFDLLRQVQAALRVRRGRV